MIYGFNSWRAGTENSCTKPKEKVGLLDLIFNYSKNLNVSKIPASSGKVHQIGIHNAVYFFKQSHIGREQAIASFDADSEDLIEFIVRTDGPASTFFGKATLLSDYILRSQLTSWNSKLTGEFYSGYILRKILSSLGRTWLSNVIKFLGQ